MLIKVREIPQLIETTIRGYTITSNLFISKGEIPSLIACAAHSGRRAEAGVLNVSSPREFNKEVKAEARKPRPKQLPAVSTKSTCQKDSLFLFYSVNHYTARNLIAKGVTTIIH